MRSTTLAVSALLSSLSAVLADECHADNCLRALRATQTPGRLEAAQSFCATFTVPSATVTAIPSYAADACKANDNGGQAARISSACACIAPSTTQTSSATVTASPTEPCAIASSSWAAQVDASPTPIISAELAHACLNSVPLGKEEAIELVDGIVPYLEWQSDAAYKADPPSDYPYPAVDIFGNLAKVRANIVADKYASEFEFQTDLYGTVFAAGHDGHYTFYPDALAKVFDFRRPRSLVSISEDGSSLPVVKFYDEVVANPSAAGTITHINGEEAAAFIGNIADKGSYSQDKDASYNGMFSSLLNPAGYFSVGGRARFFYQGPNTTYTFANGTEITDENLSGVRWDLSGVVDGPSFYAKFCATNTTAPADTPASSATGAIAPGYPEPVIVTSDGVVSGYYLEGEGFDDVAVIALTSFEGDSVPEFQAVIQEFFANATAAGKTKLVIDFQLNGGGIILLGYDFFRQLFPSIDQEGDSRWKENDAFNSLSEIWSDKLAGVDPHTNPSSELVAYYESWFNYRYDLNDSNKHFSSFDDKFAPHVYKDTKYTNRMRWDLNDDLTTTNVTYGVDIEISGYGTRSNLTQPFAAENIVILYDGFCASTCTLASEFLRVKAGVKSVAFGGRPTEGLIQGVGGVKGAQVLQFSEIYSMAQDGLEFAETDEQKAALERYSIVPLLRSTAGAVNVRDQILPGNVNDGVPAQFVQEPADCRLYWTAPMITDATAVWKAAADSAFNGAKCAAGGISKPAKRDPKSTFTGAGKSRNPPLTAERRAELASRKVPTDARWEAVYRQVIV
ncbi:pyridine nucleotide-disulfide oxidoreductase family protein [Thozetella sp. PMI_491]|nr:pyridine nucleotide-disulfide oxidoreductase family protein [Thozetella sp. PMI_491]